MGKKEEERSSIKGKQKLIKSFEQEVSLLFNSEESTRIHSEAKSKIFYSRIEKPNVKVNHITL